jgi:hypothetical protein
MRPGTRQIMMKLAKGPSSINELLRKELEESSPPWEAIQGQAKEYATESASLAKYDPPRGSKESWAKLTAEWAESAADLDKAAQAKDKDAAKAAHTELNTSCMACHREHRQMGRGGMGGPPRKGFGGPGAPGGPGGPPPPGGPGGPPPGGPPPGGPPPEGGFGGPPPPPGGPPPQ